MKPIITILGGSSVTTPVLIAELARAQSRGHLPPLHIRLQGRDERRLPRIAAYARTKLAQLDRKLYRQDSSVEISIDTDISSAIRGAALIVCQIRPGGMRLRAEAEELAIGMSIPGDEGIGPSGLMCFLCGRATLDRVAQAISKSAPHATVLMMTSPLGLAVDRFVRIHGLRCFGICELPAATARLVKSRVEPQLDAGPLHVRYLGLNHQCWLHVFRDVSGADRTAEVLKLIDDKVVHDIDTTLVQSISAIPVRYLSLYYHTDKVLAFQRGERLSRGGFLCQWQQQMHSAYVDGDDVDYRAVDQLLRQRDVSWYSDGVVPAIRAFLNDSPLEIPLNLPSGSTVPGVNDSAIIELPCLVSARSVTPIFDHELPFLASELFTTLLDYEYEARNLPDQPSVSSIYRALLLHPFVKDRGTAMRFATEIYRRLPSHQLAVI